jgi:putative PIN family toxin of toxin-antitoxin system
VLVVFDSNVIVSGLKSADGASFGLLTLVRAATLRTAVTTPLVFEYEDVCSRPGLLPHLSPKDITAFLDWFVFVSSHHEIHFLWRPLLRDPKDDMVLEAAVTASADYLVTHNTADFREAASLGIRVVTPARLLRLISHSAKP